MTERRENSHSDYEKYVELFTSDLRFAVQYISANYPFSYSFLIQNFHKLIPGNAHYTTYISDIEWVFASQFGLSYNTRIKWNSKLRARYEYGFDNPYMGYVDGLGTDPVEYDEKDFQDKILPLSFEKEILTREWISLRKANDREDFQEYDFHALFGSVNMLTYEEVSELWNSNRLKLLINESIWDNTLSHILDESFCKVMLQRAERKL